MEVKRFNGKAKEEDQGAVALVLDPAKAFERVSLPVVWAATHFSFPRKVLRVLCGYFECGRTALDHHGPLAGVEVELLASYGLCCRMR